MKIAIGITHSISRLQMLALMSEAGQLNRPEVLCQPAAAAVGFATALREDTPNQKTWTLNLKATISASELSAAGLGEDLLIRHTFLAGHTYLHVYILYIYERPKPLNFGPYLDPPTTLLYTLNTHY